jgi:hypothetical protein
VPDVTAITWTAAELIADVRRKARIPAGTLDYTDNDLLNESTRLIWSFAGWAMSQAGGERSTLLTTPYGGAREVDLPMDALADTVDSVVWVNNNGIEQRLELIQLYDQSLYDTRASTGEPWGYSLIDGRIRLYPRPVATGTVRIAYQRRHAQLVVDPARIRTVSGYTPSTTSIDFTCVAPAPFTVGQLFDVIFPHPPYRYVMTNADASGNPPLGTIQTFTYNSTTFAGFNINGYTLVKSGDTPYVHLPLEFKQALTQKIAAQVLGEIGDAQGAQLLEQSAAQELARVIELLSPRSQTARIKVVNPFSLMRMKRSGRGAV